MGFEGGGRFEGRRIETNGELGELRQAFFGIVRHGNLDELTQLLREQPQRQNGKLLWLLTSGLAVELITGYERKHKDLDIVVMDPKNEAKERWEILGTDNVTPEQYWADMFFDPDFLKKTSVNVDFKHKGKTYSVLAVHPVIIMTQKLSNAFGRGPREKDFEDAFAVLKDWERNRGGNATWIGYVNHALKALPEGQQSITEKRINTVVPLLLPLKSTRKK